MYRQVLAIYRVLYNYNMDIMHPLVHRIVVNSSSLPLSQPVIRQLTQEVNAWHEIYVLADELRIC
jgi:hypothetical protein